MLRLEEEDNFVMPSVPVNNGVVTLRDLRDLLEAVDHLPETAVAFVMLDEIRVEVQR